MFHDRRQALLASARPLELELKDDSIGVPELKKAVDDIGDAFTKFRSKNDERLDQLAKKGEDAVTKAEAEKLNKAIDDAVAEFKKRADDVEAKANRLALSGGPGSDPEHKAAKEFGEFVGKADMTVEEFREYKGAVDAYIRRAELKATTLQVGQDPAGGYWVSPDTSGRMVKKLYETTPMRQLANVVSIGTDKLEGPVDNGEADASWVGETTARTQTDLPTIGMWEIPAHELYAYPMVTQKLLEDAKINVEQWLADKATSKFARKENAGFVNGTGVLQPRGLFTYDTAATADASRPWGTFQFVGTGSSGGFGATTNGSDKLLDLIFETKAGYRQAAKFLMARRTMGGVRKLKGGDGNYIAGISLRDGALVENIFGYGVVDGEDVPAIGADSLSIAFGDFAEAYIIVDRLGVAVIRDNITRPGFVKFHMRKRVGGGAVNFEAVKFLKFG